MPGLSDIAPALASRNRRKRSGFCRVPWDECARDPGKGRKTGLFGPKWREICSIFHANSVIWNATHQLALWNGLCRPSLNNLRIVNRLDANKKASRMTGFFIENLDYFPNCS
jgi:hypothetical protein